MGEPTHLPPRPPTPEERRARADQGTGRAMAGDAVRCWWPNGLRGADPLMVAYHDEEWGVPVSDDRALFERLALEGFQAGLSWATILRKREAFRLAFADFEPEVVAAFGEADRARLLADAGIVRNRAKIDATIGNAALLLALAERFGSFAAYLAAMLPRPAPTRKQGDDWQDVPAPRPNPMPCRPICAVADSVSSARRSSTASCRASAWWMTICRAASDTAADRRLAPSRAGSRLSAESAAAECAPAHGAAWLSTLGAAIFARCSRTGSATPRWIGRASWSAARRSWQFEPSHSRIVRGRVGPVVAR